MEPEEYLYLIILLPPDGHLGSLDGIPAENTQTARIGWVGVSKLFRLGLETGSFGRLRASAGSAR